MIIESISTTDEILQKVIDHSKKELPNEACGYITGSGTTLNTVYEMTNVDHSPVHFSFDPKEQFQAVKDSRKKNEHPIVVYHSHPESPPRLSNEDLRLLNDPNIVYMIISLDNLTPSIKAYQIFDGDIHEVSININQEVNDVKTN